MKLKSLLCLLLVVIMAFGMVTVSAAEYIEIAQNGDLEGDGSIYWDGGGKAGTGLSTDFAHSGEYSYKDSFDSTEGVGNVIVRKFDAFEGATYNFSMWVYIDKQLVPESHPGVQILFYDDNNKELFKNGVELEGAQEGKWYEIKTSGEAPVGTTNGKIYLRMYKGGTYYWDDCSLQVTGSKKIMDAYKEKLALEAKLAADAQASYDAANAKALASEIVEGSPNLIDNGSFEEGSGNAAKSWHGYQSVWGEVTSRTNEEARTGEYSMKIDTRGSDRARFGPFINQQIFIEDGLIPGQTYVFTAWAKMAEYGRDGGAFIKMEPYSARYNALNTMLDAKTTGYYTWKNEDPDGNEWHPIKLLLEVEQETKMITMLIRMQHEGVVYFDDISFGLAETGNRFELYSTRTFCYTEDEFGTAVADVNTAFYPVEENSTIEFALKDGETVLDSATLPAAQEVIWNFDINAMPEELKAYTLEATYKDAAGNPIGDKQEKRVYRTHRPKRLDGNGNFIDENGEIFYPIIGYGDANDFWQESEIHGINVFKTMVDGHDFDNMEEGLKKYGEMLDAGHKEGIKFFLQLGSTEPNAYPTAKRFKQIEAILKNFGNHPAVFAWIVIDEVSMKINSGGKIKEYDYMEYWLEQSYIQIRKYDQSAPVYILDTGNKANMLRSSRIGDIFATDPYAKDEEAVSGYTYIRARWSGEGNKEQVPVAIIAQMTPMSKNHWRPTITGVRHQFYQGFWGGVKMIGFFSMTGASDMVLESIKDIPERYQEWCDFVQSGEKDIIFKHFSEKNTILIANWQENDVWYRIWQDPANGQTYLAVMNMHAAEHNADIKLVSNNGKISFDGYTATLVNGAGLEKTVSSADNSFRLTMPSLGVGLYKLNANTPFDIAAVNEDAYADIAGFDWAEKEIETLAMKEVVNEIAGGFAPGENITRADFAGFLIRTLGLTADASSTFDDIDPNHYYAKEIAMGKALGILTGVGNNLYNPDEAISRQDVMTICSRGMEIAKTLDTTGALVRLDSFKDKDLFADYAALHASKMVIENIVKGNPDGTINPLGNTTRAEAAVMMYRIMYKGQIKTKA